MLTQGVECGVDPGDFISIDPNDATKTLSVKGAHQLGFQKSPLKYFWAADGMLRPLWPFLISGVLLVLVAFFDRGNAIRKNQ